MLFKDYIANVKAEGRIVTAATYTATLNSLLEIKKNYRISDITTAFLKQYETFHRKKGNSDTTIGINMRNIRAVVNKAIAQKLLPQEKYPFKRYVIPSGQNVKKALEWEAIQKLLKYKPTDDGKKKAFDFCCSAIFPGNYPYIKRLQPDQEFLKMLHELTYC